MQFRDQRFDDNPDSGISLFPKQQRGNGAPKKPRRKTLSRRMFAYWAMVDGQMTCLWEWDR
ncbi:MAG: hypothetical protein AAF215_03460 [Cyanobacteria bacterium P01_A01_bin.123]